MKIPGEIFPHCLGVEGARPRARHLHDSRAAPFPFLPRTQLSCSEQLCSVPREGEKGKKQSVDEKSCEDQKLFSFGEEFFREKSASAGGRKDATQPFHTQDLGSQERPAGNRDSAGPKGRRIPRNGSATTEHRGSKDIPCPHFPDLDRFFFPRRLVSSAGSKEFLSF